MGIYNPLTDRYLGQLQPWPEIRQAKEQPQLNYTGLVPCFHLKLHCPKCKYFNQRSEYVPESNTAVCGHCGQPARVLEYCRGFSSPGSPAASKPQKWDGHDPEIRGAWMRQDGTRAKPQKRYGVRRRGQ